MTEGDVTAIVEISVTNTGQRDCEEVVQCYLRGPSAKVRDQFGSFTIFDASCSNQQNPSR